MSNKYTGYQARLIAEYDDLKVKIEKLSSFNQSDIFKTLESDEQTDLQEQLVHMQNYHQILHRRLNRKGLI
jgi:hypothetical protein